MNRHHTLRIQVEFGDCDPAQIVYFPNFFRWVDASGRAYFIACGLPDWRETTATMGIIGTPLVSTESRFLKPATYGDTLDIDTTISEWRGKSFVFDHVIRRGDDRLVEVREVRVFAARVEGDMHRLAAVPIPALFKEGVRAVQEPARPAAPAVP
jgi:4-hydroxybenzoyl-CoA thioesterase